MTSVLVPTFADLPPQPELPELEVTSGMCASLYSSVGLSDLLFHKVHRESDHHWSLASSLLWGNWHLAALWVAAYIADTRCEASPQLFDRWCARVEGRPVPIDVVLDQCVEAQVAADGAGTRFMPAKLDRLQGYVAEHVWHALTLELGGALGPVHYLTDLSWDVQDHGADGVAFFVTPDSTSFRLWEVKGKRGRSTTVEATVAGARRQIESNNTRYLARVMKAEAKNADPEIRSIVEELTECWLQSDPRAGGGVAVIADSGCSYRTPFASLAKSWGFSAPDQAEGFLGLIPHFEVFCYSVRGHLWNGL